MLLLTNMLKLTSPICLVPFKVYNVIIASVYSVIVTCAMTVFKNTFPLTVCAEQALIHLFCPHRTVPGASQPLQRGLTGALRMREAAGARLPRFHSSSDWPPLAPFSMVTQMAVYLEWNLREKGAERKCNGQVISRDGSVLVLTEYHWATKSHLTTR